MAQRNLLNQQSTVPNLSSIQELIDLMMNLKEDPLAEAGANIVIYRGNLKANLLIIGEAPGPQENIEGKPFVGRAGKLLDRIISAVNINPETEVLITNSVFRMPPGKAGKTFRKPTLEEINYYKPYVFEIIRLVNPKIILLAGNVACQSVLGETGITKLRGQWIFTLNRMVMPIFHPSYLLRNPSNAIGSPKSLMWDDIREVRSKYDEYVVKTAQNFV